MTLWHGGWWPSTSAPACWWRSWSGSGIAVTRLTHDGALQLLVNSVVTAIGLAV